MEHIGLAHLGLHVLTITVSLVLLVLASLAYMRERGRRLALVCAAFGLFAVQQVLTLVDVRYLHQELTIPLHVLSLIVVLLFFFGLLQHD